MTTCLPPSIAFEDILFVERSTSLTSLTEPASTVDQLRPTSTARWQPSIAPKPPGDLLQMEHGASRRSSFRRGYPWGFIPSFSSARPPADVVLKRQWGIGRQPTS